MRLTLKRLICLILIFSLVMGTGSFAETAQDSASYEPLTYYMKDSDGVRRMQLRLKELGYLKAGASGGYYKETAAAVEAFQKMAGLEVNSRLASAEMLQLLFSDEAPTVDGGLFVPTPEPTPEPTGSLTFGMRDSDGVRQAQKRLQELGYFSNSITGNFFEATQQAFEAFQAKAGLKVYGKAIDDQTLKALFSESAPSRNASPSATVTPMPTPTPTPVYTVSPDATPRPALHYGETSESIREMQKRLKELGYLKAGASGSYWKETANAVAAFQEAASLTVNGRTADTATLSLLFSADAPVKGGPTPEPALNSLFFGQSGSSEVRKMQDRLHELGYFKEVSTGGYYLQTAEAIAAFQQAAGLTVNGDVASVEMLEALYASDAPAFGSVKPTATPAPTQTAEPTPTPAPTAQPDSAESAYTELRYGMKDSDAVRRMQAKLQQLGYLDANPTGGYWAMTATAVREFLEDWGLGGNGRTASPKMQALLFSGEPEADDTPDSYGTLRYGMEGSAAVKAMQTRLRELGYFSESSTGNYYTLTAKAVAAFQTAAGFELNRELVTPEMQRLLFSDSAPVYDETAAPPASDDELPELSTDYQPLSYGMNGSSEVRAMQKKLKERSFLSASATGGYYSETRKAVAAFQEYCNLPVNGRQASAEMLGYLFYTGDLDALIAANSAKPPVEDEPSTDSGEYDPEKYKDAKLNVLMSKGDGGSQVRLLIERLRELGYLTGSTPKEYTDEVADAVKWFQNTNLLDADGIAGPATLKRIYSADAISADESMQDNASSGQPEQVEGEEIKVSIGTVLSVDWFSEEGKTYYDRRSGLLGDGDTAIITDVDTGRSIRVRRSGGYNHADVEPLTAYDTWVLYEIYDHEWSWKRHAVYVTLSNGVTLAGSINGMPHGTGSISDNNFDGHICIHFLNSRTHGTDKVDPDHQAAVSKAGR